MAGRETDEDFLRMQQEAINRVREMQMRARRTLENNGMHIENQRYQSMGENGTNETGNNYNPMTEENNNKTSNSKTTIVSRTSHYIPNTPEIGKVDNMKETIPSQRQDNYVNGYREHQSSEIVSEENSVNRKTVQTDNINDNSPYTQREFNGRGEQKTQKGMNDYRNFQYGNEQRPGNNVNSHMNYPQNQYIQQQNSSSQENKSIKNGNDGELTPPQQEQKKATPIKSDGGLGDLLNIPLSGLNINIDKDQLILLGTLYALFKDGGDNWLMMAVAYILFT